MIQEATAATAGESSWAGLLGILLPFLLIFLIALIVFLIIYFAAIRPEKQRKAQYYYILNTLQPGDKIVTFSGIIGTVIQTGASDVLVEFGEGNAKSQARILKSTIKDKITPYA